MASSLNTNWFSTATSKIVSLMSYPRPCSVFRPGIGKCYPNAEDHKLLQQKHSQKIWFICWHQDWWLRAMKHVRCLRRKSVWASEVAESVCARLDLCFPSLHTQHAVTYQVLHSIFFFPPLHLLLPYAGQGLVVTSWFIYFLYSSARHIWIKAQDLITLDYGTIEIQIQFI